MARPQPGTYPTYFEKYIKLVDTENLREAIQKHSPSINRFVEDIPRDKVDYCYAEGKWTVKELVQHLIDAERIFAYRALTIARGDQTPLPGFDETTYAAASKADARKWEDLVEEFKAVRQSTDLLFKSFTEDQLQQRGTTNQHKNTVNAIGFTAFGHLLHHKNILEEKYL